MADKPAKTKHSTKPVGPFSKDRRLTTAGLDARSKVGRLMRQTKSDLSAQLGGDPSPAECLLIQAAALKACRLYLLSDKLIGGEEPGEGSVIMRSHGSTAFGLILWLWA